jgi:hypothetical protein
LCIQPHDPETEQKEKKKGQIIIMGLIEVGKAITLSISAYSLCWSALYSLPLRGPKESMRIYVLIDYLTVNLLLI